MNLCRLLYLSELVTDMTNRDIRLLVEKSKANNEALGITGLLLHSGRHFMQVLEGDELRVASLYARIACDPRHIHVRTLLMKPAEQRLFSEWGMQLADADLSREIDRERVDKTLLRLRLSSGDAKATEAAALDLLQEFRRQLMNAAA